MFFQFLFYIIIAIVFGVCLWKWVIKPALIGVGIENEIKKDRLTTYQVHRDQLKEMLAKLKVDAEAAEEMVDIKKESVELEARIKELDEKIKELTK